MLCTNFINAWFGGTAPAGFTSAAYGGSGVGLSTNPGDAVNIYDSVGTLMANVTFGLATTGVTFDNAAGLSGPVSTTSQAGVNGAFVSPAGETGSPGVIPEPSTAVLASGGLLALAWSSRRRSFASA